MRIVFGAPGAKVARVGIEVTVRVRCDACRATTEGVLVVDKLRPTPALHVRLPEGWTTTTRAESGEVATMCNRCFPDAAAHTMRAAAVDFADPATDPMLVPLPGQD